MSGEKSIGFPSLLRLINVFGTRHSSGVRSPWRLRSRGSAYCTGVWWTLVIWRVWFTSGKMIYIDILILYITNYNYALGNQQNIGISQTCAAPWRQRSLLRQEVAPQWDLAKCKKVCEMMTGTRSWSSIGTWLVVWTPLKNIIWSVGMIILNIWKNKKCSRPTNRYQDCRSPLAGPRLSEWELRQRPERKDTRTPARALSKA